MPRLLFLAFLALALAACADAPDPAADDASVPSTIAAPDSSLDPEPSARADTARLAAPSTLGDEGVDAETLAAFDAALDTLEAFVYTLQRVEGPITAWNLSEEATRRLLYLERNSTAFALDMDEAEANRRYPARMERLRGLEALSAAEMERIGKDPAAMRVLLEEMAKAEAAADTAGR